MRGRGLVADGHGGCTRRDGAGDGRGVLSGDSAAYCDEPYGPQKTRRPSPPRGRPPLLRNLRPQVGGSRLRFTTDAVHRIRRRSDHERTDADRLELLDRIAARIPDLDQQQVEWTTLDDGHDALLVNGGGIDGGSGAYFVCAGEDVHAVGSLDRLVPGHIGYIVIKRDGSR